MAKNTNTKTETTIAKYSPEKITGKLEPKAKIVLTRMSVGELANKLDCLISRARNDNPELSVGKGIITLY